MRPVSDRSARLRRLLLGGYGAALCAVSSVMLLWPGLELARALFDRNLAGGAPATQAWRWHRALTPAYASWATARVGSDAAASLAVDNIAGTEWPLFGSVFYLRATEQLDRAWQARPHGERPALYARAAIDAAAALLADPAQAAWVQLHWGDNTYLQRENVFYRMLLIDGLATHARLTGDTSRQALLRAQVDGLADELSASPTGLLADYPGETYPADVAAAWFAILAADPLLGTDHRAAAQAGLRGFTGAMAPTLAMPPYAWYGKRSPAPTEVRGCANVWLLLNAAAVWPAQAQAWFAIHTREFWQDNGWIAGYREFERGGDDALYSDVDSGPVVFGLGTSATAFGVGATRMFGATREARALALEAVALSWPLPNGRLLGPRLLSDLADAPLLGEAAMLYNLTQPTLFPARHDASAWWRGVPRMVWAILLGQWLLGTGGMYRGVLRLRAAWARDAGAGS